MPAAENGAKDTIGAVPSHEHPEAAAHDQVQQHWVDASAPSATSSKGAATNGLHGRGMNDELEGPVTAVSPFQAASKQVGAGRCHCRSSFAQIVALLIKTAESAVAA